MAALAHGIAIVSTQPWVKIPEIVEGENMALVAPDDVEGLVGKVRQLAASPEQRNRLRRGAAQLSRQFSWESIAERTLELYARLLEEDA